MSRFRSMLLFPMLLWCSLVFGQGITTGSITGTVQDPQQAVISGAKVTAVQIGTNSNFTATTNSAGIFVLRGLPVGNYDLAIEAPQFNKLKVGNVAVNSGIATDLGIQALKVGDTAAEVTVEGGVAPLVQTDTLQIGQTFETRKTADLPIGNGFDIVALLTPGVAPSGDNAFTNNNGADFSANGQRGRANNFQIDGQTNNDTSVGGPLLFFGNQDAIAEVQVLTNYSAEYGRNAGSVVNYVTKAGTNSFHGTAFESYQGNWGDARSNTEKSPLLGFCPPGVAEGTVTAFATSGCTKSTIARLVDNRFGGTLGGPILRDKLWFFMSSNIERIRTGTAPSSGAPFFTPTPNGLSQLSAAFPGNAAVAALKAVGPTSIKTGTTSFGNIRSVNVNGVPIEFGQITRNVAAPVNDWEGTGRVDYQLSEKDKIFGRYVIQDQLFSGIGIAHGALNATQALAEGSFVDVPGRTHQVGIDYTRTWTPNLVNQARISYSHARAFFEGGAFGNCLSSNFSNCPPSIQFTNSSKTFTLPSLTFGLATNMPQGRLVENTQVQDNASWQIGRHLLKFGGEYGRQSQPNTFLPNTNGTYSYSDFQSFINGTPTSVAVAIGNPKVNFTENQGAFYFQDDWRATDTLTLTLGARYEIRNQAINVLHDLTVARESNASTALWNTNVPLALRTVPQIPADTNNISPVVGFSWSPRGGGFLGGSRTVIRGGFRISYEPEFYNLFTNVSSSSPTVNSITGLTCTNCLPASGLGGDVQRVLAPILPAGVNPGLRNQTIVAPDIHSPYTEQWSFGIQREIGSRMVGELRYVGNHSVGLFQDQSPNVDLAPLIAGGFSNLIPAGVTPCADPTAPGRASGSQYIDCNHRKVLERANTGFSIYHGLQSRLNIQNWHGVTAGVSYTFSKNIDNATEVFSTLGGGSTTAFPQNPFNTNEPERATSGLDYPNIASVYMLYDLPWFRDQRGLLGRVLGGWQINPVWRYTSGQPYTVIQTRGAGPGGGICDPSGVFSTTFSSCRPFLSNNAAAIDTVGQCTNPAAPGCGLTNFFTGDLIATSAVHWIVNDTNSQKFFGSPFLGAGRNRQRGDTINNVNLAVIKGLKLSERFNMQLRAIAYNVMNRDYRGNPDPLIDDLNFADGQGSFGNTFFNPTGANQTNAVFSGIGRRRIEIGAKIIF
jgi:outer membrane receptor protein involved in Fe transport